MNLMQNPVSPAIPARPSAIRDSAFVFATERGGPFTLDAVNRLVKRICPRPLRLSGERRW
jgi:hypothetical protein